MRRNTHERWGSVSIGLHWTIAALVLLVQVPAGIGMVASEPGTLQNVLYNVHKTTGLTIFILAVVRLGWRWINPVPALPADLPGWQARLARLTHGLLYLLLFLMPISGFLYTTLGGFPVPFFGLYDLSRLMPVNKPLGEVFKTVHLSLQFALYAVVLLHVAGALQHHLVRQDSVLRRMLSSRTPLPESRGGTS
jgi:cytochrome b561